MNQEPYFDIPLNLPHAGTLAERILRILEVKRIQASLEDLEAENVASRLVRLLAPYRQSGENPAAWLAECVRQEAAQLGCVLVEEIEKSEMGEDRLGQYVRNLFECLEMGKEGARLGLRAGENPDSPQRPR